MVVVFAVMIFADEFFSLVGSISMLIGNIINVFIIVLSLNKPFSNCIFTTSPDNLSSIDNSLLTNHISFYPSLDEYGLRY